LPPLLMPRFAWLACAPEFTLIPLLLAMETWFAPVSRMPQLPGPAVPRPNVSANAEELQDKTSSRVAIQTSLAQHALQEAGLLYEHLLPDQWSTWTDTKGN
jgi:hypothetical protein